MYVLSPKLDWSFPEWVTNRVLVISMTSLKLNIDDRIASPRQQWSHNIVFCGPPNKASSGGCRYEWASRHHRYARGRSSKRFPAHFLKMQLVLKVFTSRKTRRGALKAKLFFSFGFSNRSQWVIGPPIRVVVECHRSEKDRAGLNDIWHACLPWCHSNFNTWY